MGFPGFGLDRNLSLSLYIHVFVYDVLFYELSNILTRPVTVYSDFILNTIRKQHGQISDNSL